MNTTIIYYTSNQERPELEERVKKNLLGVCGNLPIISVSQKPIDLGKNICVGEVGASGYNMFRQVQIACEEAKTKFVLSAEADCLYPPDYFKFTPEQDDVCYRNSNLYVMGHHRNYFFKKEGGATHAQIVGREFYLKRLKKLFGDGPKWSVEQKNFPKEKHRKEDVFDEIEYYQTENPVVQIKTSQSMRHYTDSDRKPIQKIDYWGDGKDFRRKYYDKKKGIDMNIYRGLSLKGRPAEIPDCSRNQLPEFFKKMGYKVGAEIGVYKGGFTRMFCDVGLKMYGIDPWKAYPNYQERYNSRFQERQDFLYGHTKRYLKEYLENGLCELVRKTSMEAIDDFKNDSLDFVYIDGHHGFRYVAEDLVEWTRKVKKGGIISGHDYAVIKKDAYDPYVLHVKHVLHAYTDAFNVGDWYVLGRKETLPGELRDKWRSWMWIKE